MYLNPVYYGGKSYMVIPRNSYLISCISGNTLFNMTSALAFSVNDYSYKDRMITVHGTKAFTTERFHNTYYLKSLSLDDRKFFLDCFDEARRVRDNLKKSVGYTEKIERIQELIGDIFGGSLTKAKQLSEQLTDNRFSIKEEQILKGSQTCYLYDLIEYILKEGEREYYGII